MSISKLFDGYNAGYAQELYEQFARNPGSVSPQWREIFSRQLDELLAEGLITPDAYLGNGHPAAGGPHTPRGATGIDVGSGTSGLGDGLLPQIARAASLIQAFRDHGHQLAEIDPLGSPPPGHPQLDPAFFGTSLDVLDQIPTSLVMGDGGDQPLSETLQELKSVYCGSIGYQFEHLEDPDKVRWLWNEVESGRHWVPLLPEEKIGLLRRLSEVEGLERFLHRAYLGQKRFSIEGTDMMVPMLDMAIRETSRLGGSKVVIGMAHRGRLNVLIHILGVEFTSLLREFEGAPQLRGALAIAGHGSGDVKYHHGARGEFPVAEGASVEVTLAPNPSHLEFVNPVVSGMARALQLDGVDSLASAGEPRSVVPILIHGDAAFAAEGVVAESLNLARLKGYSVGGTIHIIANNQVGFTTDPHDGRSTRYASDVAKGYDIPVVHVNADDPEACLAAVRLAMAYRERFRDDLVIDLVGYRRFGHNEGDEPTYTQPLLYRKIQDHPTARALWAQKLVEEGAAPASLPSEVEEEVLAAWRAAQSEVQEEVRQSSDKLPTTAEAEPSAPPATSVPLEIIAEVNEATVRVPEGFQIHPKLRRQLDRRRSDFGPDMGVDWAHAESLAFGTLLREGVAVRLSGQDCERGTFSQRHLVLHDPDSGVKVTPLRQLGGGRFEVYNSPLSEVAVLGFEYGYSVVSERTLVLWEAQFGDFVNVAQVIIDQFIASGRTKWGQQAGLTLLLPHGAEGQGPEHSSARLERFLQLCAEDNMRVAYPTTPAQYFHLLRRQALAGVQRPLIVMTPKSLLRLPQAVSPVREMVEEVFRPVLADPTVQGEDVEVTRLVLCSGKVYYDLITSEERRRLAHVAIGRVEELYPFPAGEIAALLGRYPNLKEVVWAQEEPRNMGALSFIGPRLRAVVPREIPLRHVARPERASPAEGKHKNFVAAQERIVREALL